MARRKTVIATGETYHVFNRSVRQAPIFTDKREFSLFLKTVHYYLQAKPPVKFSNYRVCPSKYKTDYTNLLVKVIAYCLMPNHYHFILTQVQDKGIENFIHRSATSYSCYFNIKHEQKGPVFEGNFKAVRVENQYQLVHLSRYLHLNPVTAYIVEDPAGYEFSSYKDYLMETGSGRDDFLDKEDVLADFSTSQDYQKFVLDQKDYQRELDKIKHLTIE